MTQVKFNGKIYTLTQDAYYSNGNTGEYQASAIDKLGNEYMIYWTIREDIDQNTAEEDEMCNWDEPSRVEIHYTYDEDTILDMIRSKAIESGIDYDYYYQFAAEERKNIKKAYTDNCKELIEDGIADLKQALDELETEYRNAEKQEGGK